MALWNRLLQTRIPLPTLGRLMAGLSVLGAAGLGYLYGAAVMFFQLPSADYLDKCFAGARAWHERGRSSIPPLSSASDSGETDGVRVDKADKTSDGFTLYTTSAAAQATLIDMRGRVVHRWELPFSRAWKHAPHVPDPLGDDQIHWFRCRLFANGDLLAIYHADGDTPYGYGLVKLDKDSKLLWTYANNVHHDLDVDEDGAIYTLTQKIASKAPAGLEEILPVPLLADSLVILSPEGRELESIPLLEALRDSPYAPALSSASKYSALIESEAAAPSGAKNARSQTIRGRGDPVHANSVKVLPRALAANFPLFKPGQILVSLRNLDTLAVLDRRRRSVVWASGGIWRIQHDAELLENGRLLLYDNFGSFNKGTRILEYDPLTQAIAWCYGNENSTPFSAFFRGMKQRLSNGNTLIVDPENRRLFEVTRDKELVWESFCPLPPISQGQRRANHAVTGARRYRADELTFLKGVARVRP